MQKLRYNISVVFILAECCLSTLFGERGYCMERRVGTTSRGIRGPIIREGDDLAQIVVDSVLAAAESEGFGLNDRDVVAVTESVVARAQGNYASVDAIAICSRAAGSFAPLR